MSKNELQLSWMASRGIISVCVFKARYMLMSDLKNLIFFKSAQTVCAGEETLLIGIEKRCGRVWHLFQTGGLLSFHMSRSASSPQLRHLKNHILVTISETLCWLVSVCQKTTCTVLLLLRHQCHCCNCILSQALLAAEMALVYSC